MKRRLKNRLRKELKKYSYTKEQNELIINQYVLLRSLLKPEIILTIDDLVKSILEFDNVNR